MSRTMRIIGPPGTGKSYTIALNVKAAAKRYGNDKVLVTSMTKAAAAEIAGRDLAIDADHVGTLHAFCYRALDRPVLAETKDGISDWNAWSALRGRFQSLVMTVPKTKGGERGEADELVFTSNGESGDRLFELANLYRARMMPEDQWPVNVRYFYKVWKEWKAGAGMTDFTDWLEMALDTIPEAPGKPSAIFADEAQDNSRLEMALLSKWGGAAEVLTAAGDPRQAIMTFRGASPEVFYERDIPPENERLLDQSYRVPRAVHAIAEKWISQSAEDRKRPQVYKPRDADGEVRRAPAMARDPRYTISLVERLVGQGKSVMVLAACSYMLDKTKHALREAGIPFSNRWRRRRADWNPLYSANGITSSERLLAFLRPYSEAWGPEAREWTAGDVKHWMGALRTADLWGARGAKALMATLDDEARITEATMRSLFSQEVIGMTEMEIGPALKWYEGHLLEGKKKGGEFPIQIVRKRGPAELLAEPLVTLGTYHSTKGAEASWVLMMPDLSPEGIKGWIRPGPLHDAICRTFYVGMTRAKEGVVLCARSSLDAVGWEILGGIVK